MGRGVAAGDHLRIDIRLAAVHVTDVLACRRVDAPVVVEGGVTVTGHRLCDHDPRIGLAEDSGILLVARWIGRDLPQLQPVSRERRLYQHHTMFGRETITDAVERASRTAVAKPNAGKNAHPLGLDEDLALDVRRRSDGIAEVVVGAEEPTAVPRSEEHTSELQSPMY